MDLEIKQKLTSNWFKSLQEMFCKTISDFEKNRSVLSRLHGKEI